MHSRVQAADTIILGNEDVDWMSRYSNQSIPDAVHGIGGCKLQGTDSAGVPACLQELAEQSAIPRKPTSNCAILRLDAPDRTPGKKQARRSSVAGTIAGAALSLVLLVNGAFLFAGDKRTEPPAVAPPLLVLEGGRSLHFVRTFSSETEVKTKRSLWSRVLNFVAGAPDIHRMVRPYDVATDSQGRIIVTDPGAALVHIFDFEKQKYHKLEGGKENFKSPIGIAVDGNDNIYVADSELGKILVFDSRGKFRHYIGDLKGEGYFKRPTGLAIDPAQHRLYVTDTLRDAVYTTDLDGNILGHFGKRGDAPGEFNYPTEILVHADELIVVDAMNFRVQIFDRKGGFRTQFGQMGEATGTMFRSKGLAIDSEGDFYIADALLDVVQVFDRRGELLYFFGQPGTSAAEFQLPSGVCIDRHGKIYVVDSFNRRVEVFQYVAATPAAQPYTHVIDDDRELSQCIAEVHGHCHSGGEPGTAIGGI
jgi:DNA-binding beta-propeller fold protein YncE